ncbi:sialin-like [Antedon mediterranea]|uniref:sialin-like n=1 Tax=Antedon mediterranea TaxID=105859 RepID=UPI003AF65C03
MKRFLVAGMCAVIKFLLYCTRINMSIAMIAMVRRRENTTNFSSNDDQLYDTSIPTYNWDEMTQQIVLGAFYIGYIITPIPGGWFSCCIGGKKALGLVLLCECILTALVPIATEVSINLLIAVRVLDGAVQGVAFSAIYVLLGKWTVHEERSIMVSIIYNGITLSTIVSSHLSGWLCTAYELGGWPVSFYTYSVFGLVGLVVWTTLVYETPNTDPFITKKELELFVSSEERTNVTYSSVPWKAIFTSSAVWAIVIGYVAFDAAWYFSITEIPIFISSILGFDAKTTGFLTSIPAIARLPVVLISAACADFIIRRNILSILNTRKLCVIIDLGVAAVCFLIISQVGESLGAFMVLISITFCAFGFHPPGINTNSLDLSSKYAGIIVGIATTFASISAFIVPVILGKLTENNNTFKQWSFIFIMNAAILLFGMVFFLIFAKGEVQDWSKEDTEQEQKETTYLIKSE